MNITRLIERLCVFFCNKVKSIYCCVCIGIIAILFKYYRPLFATNNYDKTCWEDFLSNKTLCVPSCPNGSFALPGMNTCHPLLSCNDSITIKELIVSSVVKKVYLARWKGHEVVVSKLSTPHYKEDFEETLKLLLLLGPNQYTVNFLGHCNYTLITQYYKLGNALKLNNHLHNHLKIFDTVSTRLKLCANYAAILDFLHSGQIGTRVMCDSNSLEKTLSQYLLTADLKLVISDLDAVPVVSDTNNGVLCGKKELHGTFVAPEQLWPFHGKKFSVDLMPPYNEKTDMWKLPDVCNWFLGNSNEADIVKFKLFHVHKQCKNINPTERPDAKFVINVYQNVWNELFNSSFL